MTESEIQSHVPKPSSDGSGDGQRDAGENADVEQYIRNCRKYQVRLELSRSFLMLVFDDASITCTPVRKQDTQ
jgi:hypothetical protein